MISMNIALSAHQQKEYFYTILNVHNHALFYHSDLILRIYIFTVAFSETDIFYHKDTRMKIIIFTLTALPLILALLIPPPTM